MPGEDIQSWSVTAVNNGNADSAIEWREGQTRASVNNSARSEMAAHAKDRNLKNGSIVTTNTANAYAFTSGVTYTTVPTGLRVKLKIGTTTNTGSATLNMDGIGDVTIKTDQGADLRGGELIANAYTDFLYNGTNWIFLYSHAYISDQINGGTGIILSTQVFNASGTYTPTPGMACCIIECIGGGGGGGNAQAAAGEYMAGAGGGSGGYSRKVATATQIGGGQIVTVGAGGLVTGYGLPGGTTSVGTLCVANGGGGGGYAQGAFGINIPDAGAGGAPGTGDITAAGSPGNSGFYVLDGVRAYSKNASGGSGPFGGGAHGSTGTFYPHNGQAGRNYGAGGAGGISYSEFGLASGGAGSAGVVIITEFAGRGAPGHDGVQGPMGPPGPAGAGTGDVLAHGTPVAGQYARWFDTSHIEGVTLPAPPAPTAGRLVYISTTTLKFAPYNGDQIKINGALYSIPSAGIAGLANTSVFVSGVAGQNLAASTIYYVYAFNNAGTVTADFSTSVHATSSTAGNVGVEIKSGDDTRSLIGMIRTNASSQFADAANLRTVRSWFNRQRVFLDGGNLVNATSGSLTPTATNLLIGFLQWADEVVDLHWVGSVSNDNITATFILLYTDGSAPAVGTSAYSTTSIPGVNYSASQTASMTTILAEGYHTNQAFVCVGAGTGRWSGGLQGTLY